MVYFTNILHYEGDISVANSQFICDVEMSTGFCIYRVIENKMAYIQVVMLLKSDCLLIAL